MIFCPRSMDIEKRPLIEMKTKPQRLQSCLADPQVEYSNPDIRHIRMLIAVYPWYTYMGWEPKAWCARMKNNMCLRRKI